jgi:hypothetical protein
MLKKIALPTFFHDDSRRRVKKPAKFTRNNKNSSPTPRSIRDTVIAKAVALHSSAKDIFQDG